MHPTTNTHHEPMPFLSATLMSYSRAGSPLAAARRVSPVIAMAEPSLEAWLQAEAGVSAKFLPQVLSVCDDEVSDGP